MIDHELTDPTGSALTITHNADGVWITATEDHDEVTVGPFPVRALCASFDMRGDLMDGGVTAAAIEAEVVSPEQARSLVQENTELRERIGRVEEARDLYRRDVMTAERREQEASNRAERAEKERDRWREYRDGQATENPRPLTADDLSGIVRVVVIGPNGTEYERGDLYSNGAHLSVQDYGHTLKIWPNPPSRPEGAGDIEATLSEWNEMDDNGDYALNPDIIAELADHLAHSFPVGSES